MALKLEGPRVGGQKMGEKGQTVGEKPAYGPRVPLESATDH